jgi:hypothetical protein
MKKEESTVVCPIERFSEMLPSNSAFETLPVQITEPVVEKTTEMTNNLCYPSSSSSSSSLTGKKKSFKTLLSLLRVTGKRR